MPINPPGASLRIFKQSLSPNTSIEVKVPEELTAPVLYPGHDDTAVSSLVDSVKSKLVEDPEVKLSYDRKKGEFDYDVNQLSFNNTVEDTISSIREAKILMDALPDLELQKDIIISSVLSPNDMISTELIYSSDTDLFSDVTNELIQGIKDYFDNDYKITEELTGWLERVLFIEGACPLGVIPETAIDEAINSNLKITKEAFDSLYKDGDLLKPAVFGILGTPKYKQSKSDKKYNQMSLESFSVSANIGNYDPQITGMGVTVVDNPAILKTPRLIAKLREQKIAEAYHTHKFGLENYSPKFIDDPTSIYPTRREEGKGDIVYIKTTDVLEKKNIGHPTVFQFPTESVIPIHSPADPSDHVCYFIALDEYGNPIRGEYNNDQTEDLRNDFKSTMNGQFSSQMITTAKRMGIREVDNYDKNDIGQMTKLYSQVIEKDLMDRLEAGGFNSKGLKFHTATELYKLMFSRALKELNTQLLFLPKDYMTYIAFDYKPNGVGRSLLEKTKIIGSLRMVNTITDAIANAKSAIDHRTLDIRLDPDDPDPIKRTEQYLHEFQRATKADFPLGNNSYADITNYLQKAGVQVKISGHEGMPDMGMEFSNQRYDYTKPDSDYAEGLSKKHSMGLGAPPETVQNLENIEFATQIISKNAFFAKISMWRQRIAAAHFTDHVVKYTLNSQPLMTMLTDIIEKNRDKLPKIDSKFSSEACAIVFAKNIRLNLPEPDLAQLEMQSEAFDTYIGLLEKALPFFVSSQIIATEDQGDRVSQVIDHVVEILKAFYARKWLMDNNVLPELFDLVNTTLDAEENFSFLTEHDKLMDMLAPNLRDFIISGMKRGKTNDGITEKAEELLTGEEADDFGGDSGGDFDSDSGDEGGDDGFGEDDFHEDGEDTGEEGDSESDDDTGEDWDF